MSTVTLNIDVHSDEHIYMQIYKYIRSEIESGALPFNSRLPSTRHLAAHLQVSRNTIDMAYGQLLDEGYIESYPKKGFFVSDIESLVPAFSNKTAVPNPKMSKTDHFADRHTISLNNHSDFKSHIDDHSKDSAAYTDYQYDFSPYGIDLENFPFGTWRKIARDIYYDDRNFALFQSGHRQGDEDFRTAIANYLHQSRGVRCSADQIIVGAGTEYLLILLAQILGSDSIFAMEDPSYRRSYEILHKMGYPIRPIPLDKNGMSITKLRKTDATVAYVTPSNHFPLGIVMPIKRRLELLNWAFEDHKRYIIEDDYDSEFRYKGKPIPSLQSINRNEKVIYLGTFSKAIAPAIRISYLVLPKPLLEIYKTNMSFYASTVARTEQRQLTNFITQGCFERHLNRMRNIYKAKRDYLLQAFAPYQHRVKISGENSGLHLLLTFIDGRTANDITAAAKNAGIHLMDVSSYYIAPEHMNMKNTVILGYGALSMEQLKTQTECLLRILF